MNPVNMIAAMDLNGGIGKGNDIPWFSDPEAVSWKKEDLAWFKSNTMGGIIVMGRRTWESMGCKLLPGRITVVLSSREYTQTEDTDRPHWLMSRHDEKPVDTIRYLSKCYPGKTIWICGGQQTYEHFIEQIQRVYVSVMPKLYDCDKNIHEIVNKFYSVKYAQRNELGHSTPAYFVLDRSGIGDPLWEVGNFLHGDVIRGLRA